MVLLKMFEKTNIVVFVSGTGTNLQAVIDACQKGNLHCQVETVVANQECMGIERAKRHGIPTILFPNVGLTREQHESLITDELIKQNVQASLFVLAGYMRVLSKEFIDFWNSRNVQILNLHPALHGEFTGAHAIQDAFHAFERNELGENPRTGVMVHHVIEELDKGELIKQVEVPIRENDTLETLTERIRQVEKPLLISALQIVTGFRRGKVRDIYVLNDDQLLMQASSRLSAFDRHICTIPNKGFYLNQTSQWWFENTRHIIDNHMLFCEGDSMIVKRCEVIPIEMVVRAYITGSTQTSMWTNYNKGVREYCGHKLPEGLKKNQKLDKLYITPTTKDEVHDELTTGQEMVNQGIVTANEWAYLCEKTLELFRFGSAVADSRGLILVDTKFEFGRYNGQIILIDEVMTSDSSRYWIKASYQNRFEQGLEPEKYDKDIIRNTLKKSWDPYAEDAGDPPVTEELLRQTDVAYRTLYQLITNSQSSNEQFDSNLVTHNSLDEIYNHFLNTQDRVVIIAGSTSDDPHVNKLEAALNNQGIMVDRYVSSAHKNTYQTMEILEKYDKVDYRVIYVTVAGRSNALSGVVAANVRFPVIACPPFKDKMDFMVNINSTLQMPSKVPVMTILEPGNVALACRRMIDF